MITISAARSQNPSFLLRRRVSHFLMPLRSSVVSTNYEVTVSASIPFRKALPSQTPPDSRFTAAGAISCRGRRPNSGLRAGVLVRSLSCMRYSPVSAQMLHEFQLKHFNIFTIIPAHRVRVETALKSLRLSCGYIRNFAILRRCSF